MKWLLAAIVLLSSPWASFAAGPNGSDAQPIFTRPQQGNLVVEGQFECNTGSQTLLSGVQQCRSVTFRNIGTNRVFICTSGTTASSTACGVFLNEGDPFTYNRALDAGAFTCITSSSTSVVHYVAECGS
jgi:hypothetical protein